MLTGSLAAAYYAAPRATQDVDLVLEVGPGKLSPLVRRLLEMGFYVSPEAAQEALETSGQFNAVDPEHGWKVDFILRKNRPFSAEEFSRRCTATVLGSEVSIVTLEDLILAKLEWMKLGESELQRRDVIQLIEAGRGKLDASYITRWAGELSVLSEWTALREAVGDP